jgi:hypothetical protein
MADSFYVELGDYFVTCGAELLPDGKLEASALFERRRDRSKSLVPGLRHRIINATFDSEDAALQAANQLAVQLVQDGKVGLE